MQADNGGQAYSRYQNALELTLAACVNLPGCQGLQRRCADASEREDGHDGEDDPALVGESQDDKSDTRAGNTDENGATVAEKFGRRAG